MNQPQSASRTTRWLFGDQLGPHFLDGDDQPVVLIESRRVFARRRFHRQKAQLVLSAMRHRAAELGDRCTYASADTYRAGLGEVDGPLEVVQPTSWEAVGLVDRLSARASRDPAPGPRLRDQPVRLRGLGRLAGAGPGC